MNDPHDGMREAINDTIARLRNLSIQNDKTRDTIEILTTHCPTCEERCPGIDKCPYADIRQVSD